MVPLQGEPPPEARGEVLLTHAKGSPNLAQVRGARRALGARLRHRRRRRFRSHALGGRSLTCSRGASAIPIAEWVLAVMLAFEKQLPEAWIHEPPAHWSIAGLGGLYGRTLGLVGLGGIGAQVARRALAFGMRVRALRRSAAPSPLPGVEIARDLARAARGRGSPRARRAEHARDAASRSTPPRSRG